MDFFHYNRRKPVPVDSLLGKKTGVLEMKGLQMKCEVPVIFAVICDVPFLWKPEKFPFSAALRASVIVPVWLFPCMVCPWRIPYHLRVWPYQHIVSPPFQLFAGGSIQHLIVLPVICNPHNGFILSIHKSVFEILKKHNKYTMEQ